MNRRDFLRLLAAAPLAALVPWRPPIAFDMGADESSMFFVVWGERGVHGVYPVVDGLRWVRELAAQYPERVVWKPC